MTVLSGDSTQSTPLNAGQSSKKGPAKLSRKDTAGKDVKDAKPRPSPATPSEPAIDPLSHVRHSPRLVQDYPKGEKRSSAKEVY
jgi:hypothetical protein